MIPRHILALVLSLGCAWAQQATTSSSTRPGATDNNTGEALEGARPQSVLKIVKVKGVVSSVDLQKRTIVFKPSKGESIELTFSQPVGREQIKTSKKAAKRLGTKRLRLEELKPGTPSRVQYYPVLGQMLDLMVE